MNARRNGTVEMIEPLARMYRASGEEIRIGDRVSSDEVFSLRIEAVAGEPVAVRCVIAWET